MDITNKIAIVTGASYGIGRATARLFAQNGAKLVLAARSKDKLDELASELKDSMAVQTDVTKADSIKKMIAVTIKRFGRIDVLINNSGRGFDGTVEDIELEKLRYIIALNYLGPIIAMQEVIPIMRKQGGGVIVNISSGLSKMNMPTMSGYASMKAALNTISLTAREEFAKDRIVVSVVYPYITATDFEKNTLRSAGKKTSGSSNGEEWPGDIPPADPPEKVARAILELVESGQAEFIMNPWIEKGGKSNA